jgi:hypothetical protein
VPEAPDAREAPRAPYTVQPGDTLSQLAARLQRAGVPGSREAVLQHLLALNPEVTDRDRIRAGAVLQLPVALPSAPRSVDVHPVRVEPFRGEPPLGVFPERRAPAASLPRAFTTPEGLSFPVSADGTPRYRQQPRSAAEGDWGARRLNDAHPLAQTLARKGCAVTALAMALSKMTGETLTPGLVDAHLDRRGGYRGHNVVWAAAAGATSTPVDVQRHPRGAWSLARLDAELAGGRPVVIGVDVRAGGDEAAGGHGTDHWLCLTRREGRPPVYVANDPLTGEEVRLRVTDGGGLVEVARAGGGYTHGARPYTSSRQMVTFATPGDASRDGGVA